MNLNTAPVLTLLVAAISLGLAAVAAIAVVSALVQRHNAVKVERRLLLLGILSVHLAWTRLLSWPVLFWQLESWVPLIPGAMCGYGVFKATPALSWTVVVAKLLGFFAVVMAVSFRWVLQRVDTKVPLWRLLLAYGAVALVCGFDAVADARFTLAERETIQVSCCTTVLDTKDRFSASVPEQIFGDAALTKLLVSTGLCVAGFLLLQHWLLRRSSASSSGLLLAALAALLLLPLGGFVFMEWLAPMVLHLPHHHCPVEVWTETLDGGVLLALFLVAVAAPVAAFLWRSLLARDPNYSAASALVALQLLRGGVFCLWGVLAMVLVHWWMASQW